MDKTNLKSDFGIAIILGSVWGFAEVALGIGLRACASNASGSIMTGVALFFICTGWIATRRFHVPVMVVLIACLFKLFDSLFLSLPVTNGAIANPIYAFLTEGLAFLILIVIFNYDRWQKKYARALLGGGSALIAAGLFPLVKYFTGTAACVYPGTLIPLSVYFAPVAMLVSAITVPLGFLAGQRIGSETVNPILVFKSKKIRYLISPATLILCLALVAMIRLVM